MTIKVIKEDVVRNYKPTRASKYDRVIEAYKDLTPGKALELSFEKGNVFSAYLSIKKRFDYFEIPAKLHLRTKDKMIHVRKPDL